MVDQISSDSKQNFIYASFNQINAETLIVIKDQDDKTIMAFKTNRSIGNLLYSSKNLKYTSYKIYTGGTIDGEETNGLYTSINSYTGGEEISFNDVGSAMRLSKNNDMSSNILKILIVEVVLLGVFIALYVVRNRKSTQNI